MSGDHREWIARLELSIGCLQEAAERLERLCPRLQNPDYERECTETAKNITSQVIVIRQGVAHFHSED